MAVAVARARARARARALEGGWGELDADVFLSRFVFSFLL